MLFKSAPINYIIKKSVNRLNASELNYAKKTNPEELVTTSGFWIKLNMKHCCATPSQQQAFV
jgi:hypothetical protein